MITPMVLSYVVLTTTTVLMIIIAVGNWRRLGGGEHLLMAALFYYYSMYGAWNILSIKRGLAQSDALAHLEKVLFTINVDEDYAYTLVLYGTFNVLILIGFRLFSSSQPRRFLADAVHILSAPKPLIVVLISATSLLASIAIIGGQIVNAISRDIPIYLLTRTEVSQWFTIHQILNRAGIIALAFAWPLYIQGQLASRNSKAFGMILSALTLIWIVYLGTLGNRNEIFIAIIGCFYFHALIGGQIKWRSLMIVIFLSYFSLRTIETLRAVPSNRLFERFLSALSDPQFWNPAAVAGGTESLAAHISLYGVISEKMPLTCGNSIIYFLQSMIPGFPKDARVLDSYAIYANAIGAPSTQGFNIHFAAGSYLNFGSFGIFVAAIMLGLLYSRFRSLAVRFESSPSTAYGVLMGYSYFCALLPIAMRAGPEGFKALLIEGFLLPFSVVWCCSRRSNYHQLMTSL